MKRFALLIEASDGAPDPKDHIAGCRVDVAKFQRWLRRDWGGAWEEDEIRVLPTPDWKTISDAKKRLDDADFAILAFSGHGHIEEDRRGTQRQIVTIKDGVEIPFSHLYPASPKAILICDACGRVYGPLRFAKGMLKEARVLEAAAEGSKRRLHRHRYEELIDDASPGTYTVYSCSPGEFAGDDPINGGLFSNTFLGYAYECCDNAQKGTHWFIGSLLPEVSRMVADAAAKERVPRQQHPVGGPSIRSGNDFPFALCIP